MYVDLKEHRLTYTYTLLPRTVEISLVTCIHRCCSVMELCSSSSSRIDSLIVLLLVFVSFRFFPLYSLLYLPWQVGAPKWKYWLRSAAIGLRINWKREREKKRTNNYCLSGENYSEPPCNSVYICLHLLRWRIMHCANNPVGICVVGAWIKGRGRESERHWAVLVESKRCHSFFFVYVRARLHGANRTEEWK